MDNIRIFLSHTGDLDATSEERTNFVATAIRAIAALPGFSVEEQTTTFTAEDQTPAEVCRRRLAACDIYVGIIGYARGTLVNGDPAGRSFVEFEFDAAAEHGLPRIVLVWDAEAGGSSMAESQSAFRARLAEKQEIVFARFSTAGDLRMTLDRALATFQPNMSEHVSGHVEWATPAELSSLGIDARERRWAVYVRNAGQYPAYSVTALVHSNNGGDDLEIDMGTLAARDINSAPYVLNLERQFFDPAGDRPEIELSFTIAGIQWRRQLDGSLIRARRLSATGTQGQRG